MSNMPSDNDSTSFHRRSHASSIRNDPHLQVLGRDGGDLPVFSPQSAQQSHTSRTDREATSTRKSAWWNGIMGKRLSSQKQEEETEAPFVSLVDSNEQEETNQTNNMKVSTNTAAPLKEPLTFSSSKRATTTSLSSRAASLFPTRSAQQDSPTSSSLTRYSNALQQEEIPTREDEILAESSFFYRDIDDAIVARSPLQRSGSMVLAPQERSAYRARYQQLNQEYIVEEDLDLFSEQDMPPARVPSIIQDFSHSSLYFKQDGKVLMKLPKDKVRLVMDPELGAPGILSACITSTTVCSTNESSPPTTTVTCADAPPTEITYVLTVPPDIYRKVVLELAHSHTTVCSSCFASNDKLNIQVAVGLLCAILLLLFINVIIYPGD